ncbi:MAG TPA: hypothetical protein VHZ03_07585 [Trebonia sp.]|nr:hypothetical protein [Trebonia sp.]
MAAGERAPARRRLRASAAVISTLMTSILALAMFGTLSGFSLRNYFLSNYTQHHGILDSGTISNVSNTRSDHGSWSAAVRITLDRPVDGATSTTLTVGNEVNSPDGTSVTVLVDPRDPAHAEYPGGPVRCRCPSCSSASRACRRCCSSSASGSSPSSDSRTAGSPRP